MLHGMIQMECDGCGNRTHNTQDLATLLQNMKEYGWLYQEKATVDGKPVEHHTLCPECSKKPNKINYQG